ncbi:exopolyphosphatase [Oceanospirillum beijerinckii]|uniref:exopolyphosphatase n=1 Tax=Oceanospirillum beijerinckii TaxID=64976 RepID=UPI00042581BF|nr:exopolyphosphatase [Oceanospirillum beijerinckii]
MNETETSNSAPLANSDSDKLAAIDLGSNSFHLIVSRMAHGETRTLERLGEKVQLGAGLDEESNLTEEAQERALNCLRRFAPFLQGIEHDNLRIVGTNALREAENAQEFLDKAEEILGHPLEVISGREEARLIYVGAAQTLATQKGRRLVVDIGGGSTEFIIGEGYDPLALESLHMGCVAYSKRFFPDGQITTKRYQQAILAAKNELLNIVKPYKKLGWQQVVGTSGTIKATAAIMEQNGWTEHGITRGPLNQLAKHLLRFKQLDDIEMPGLKPERAKVFPAGVAILQAIFELLDIEHMEFADGALREGILHDIVGRNAHQDIREKTVRALIERHQIDTLQAENVAITAEHLYKQTKKEWQLNSEDLHLLLIWAAKLHEIGLSIAHSQFHKHGAYLLQHSDLSGFSRQQQGMLAALVRSHRRKFPISELRLQPAGIQQALIHLAILLRLAILLNHSRLDDAYTDVKIEVKQKQITLTFNPDWLEDNPLTVADLEQEQAYLDNAGFTLSFQ